MTETIRPAATWTRTARALHWGTALTFMVEVPAGFAMAWTYGQKGGVEMLHLRASQVHHTLGLLLLATTALRIVWRLTHSAPPLPSTVSAPAAWVARTVQTLLYILLLLIAVSGYAALSSMSGGAGYPPPELWFFTHNGFGPDGMIPHIVPPVPWNADTPWRYSLFAKIHVWTLVVGGAVLTLHIGAALHHHFVRRDTVLRQMLRGGGE